VARDPRRPPAPAVTEVVSGDMLCALRFWTEAEWDALPEARRPRDAAHKAGVGWVFAVPVAGLNSAVDGVAPVPSAGALVTCIQGKSCPQSSSSSGSGSWIGRAKMRVRPTRRRPRRDQ
jgi:hypothetical protein